MYIKSINICGIFDITNQKIHDFGKRKKIPDINDDLISTINDVKLIESLMLIFDSKYNDKYNYQHIINKQHKGESYVEVCLYQNEGNESSYYDWLGKDELKLKRVINHPKVIYINKKRCDIGIFHQSLSNLGFYTINNLCIHRLMDDDLSKLRSFIGDDLWNILIKVIDHEELIEMVECKAGIMRQRAMKRSFGIVVDKIQKEIPKKIELRNAIYERTQMNKNLMSLLYIMTERKRNFLDIMDKYFENKMNRIRDSIPDQVDDSFKNECIEIHREESVLEFMHDLQGQLEMLSKYYKGESCEKALSYLMASIGSFKSTNVDELLGLDASFSVDAEISCMKLCLAKSAESEAYDETKELLEAFCLHLQLFIDMLESEAASKLMIENQCDINSSAISQMEQKYLNEYLMLSKTLPELFEREKVKLHQLHTCIKNLNIPEPEFNTLLHIERLVRKFPDDFSSNYLGPVFKYLKGHSGKLSINMDLWMEIAATANIILFKTTRSMREFVKKFCEVCKDTTEVQFYAIDKLKIKEKDEDVQDFISLNDFIEDNIESEKLQIALNSLLSDSIILLDSNLLQNIDTIKYRVIYTDEVSFISHHDQTVAIQKGSICDTNVDSPIDQLHEYYALIQEYLNIEEMLMECEKFKNTSHNDLRAKKHQEIDDQLEAICKKTTFGDNKNSKILLAMKDYVVKFKELLTASRDECKSWDINELIENIGTDESVFNIFNFMELQTAENNFERQKIQQGFVKSFDNLDVIHDISLDTSLRPLLEELGREAEKYENVVLERIEYINSFQSINFDKKKYIEKNLTEQEFHELYIEKMINGGTRQDLENILGFINENAMFYFKQSIYDEFHQMDMETIRAEIADAYKQMIKKKKMNRIDLKNLDPVIYQNLSDSLGKVREYAEKEVFGHLKVKKRAFPLFNVATIKVLKDTIHNYTSAYNSVLSKYVSAVKMCFLTKSAMNEVDDSHSNWDCFNLARIKSIDFMEKWKSEKRVLSLEYRQLVKGLLLILHVINYISVFKFIVISEKMFEGMEPALADQLREFLKNVSKFVQVIIYKEDDGEISEATSISSRDILSE